MKHIFNYVTVIHTAGQFSTEINCDEAEAREYYVGRWLNIGDGEHDKMVKGLDIRFEYGTAISEREVREK